MTAETFPSPKPRHRRADLIVHAIGLALILMAGGALIFKASGSPSIGILVAVLVYILCALISNLASWAYHFSGWHDRRKLLRRIDHAAIYPSISGTFTPFFVLADTTWTIALLWICWGLTGVAVWNKITNVQVQSKWSTASYLALGAIGLSALPDLGGVPAATIWCVVLGAASYVIGTAFYTRRSMPYRYAVWHSWVNIGGILMFAGVWLALG